MVRSYLRHEPTQAFGVICSTTARSILDADGKTAYVPALEDVLVWDVRKGEQLDMWHEIGHRSPVTALARCPSPTSSHLFAVGYEDGSIRIWDSTTSTAQLTFNGHRKAVSALTFDSSGMRLASASQDTTIILWDLVAETGIFRLKGHRDLVTDLAFVKTPSSHPTDSVASSSSANPESADGSGFLLSTSKDGLLKVWDLALQHCIETIVPGKGELWSLAVLENPPTSDSSTSSDSLVLTGSADGEVKLWSLQGHVLAAGLEALIANGDQNDSNGQKPEQSNKVLVPAGTLELAAKRRVTQIAFNTSASAKSYLAISSSDRSVQIFRLREEEEMRKKMARRRRRQKEKEGQNQKKAANQNGTQAGDGDDDDDDMAAQVTWPDRVEPYTIVRPESGRLRSFAFASGTDARSASGSKTGANTTSILVSTSANSMEIHQIPSPKSKADKKSSNRAIEPVLSGSLDLPGHRSEVRALGLSSDDSLLASADSQGTLKIWNVKTGRCIRTLACGYALTLAWLPGDKYVVVGCKDGSIRTYDIPAGENVETISDAHSGPVWSIALNPDGLSCVSASADKDVKFWEFEMRAANDEEERDDDDSDEEEEGVKRATTTGPQRLALSHIRTLRMTDDVLFARYSPNGKMLALSLLDNTVKVFYADSLKFFLSLYGHKLPVLSLDISIDSKLCVTVSADKNIKIWGLDYGDCHKSIFGHQDSIMSVSFERGQQGGGLLGGREGDSHHFWTIGKDGMVKYWDGDKFELIQTMEGHHGEVWSLAVGSRGNLVVSSGADRSLRVWEKTDEPLFLEEEREKEQEKLFEAADREARERQDGHTGAVGSLVEGNEQQQTEAPDSSTSVNGGLTNSQGLMAGERLMEALDLGDEDSLQRVDWLTKQKGQGPAPPRNPLIISVFTEKEISSTSNEVDSSISDEYVLKVVEKILPAQLEDALLTLPFDKVISLLGYLNRWISSNTSRTSSNLPLLSRILFFLLRIHHQQLISTSSSNTLKKSLLGLNRSLGKRLKNYSLVINYNLVGLKYLQKLDKEDKVGRYYEEFGFDQQESQGDQVATGVVRKRKANVA
ncbi:unnamed protein product [Sympodiomycopsis kandeliae]